MHWKWIVNDSQLDVLCAHLKQQPVIGLDTEFIRETTFYAQPGLIQLADDQQVWLVDPLSIRQWSPLADLLMNPQTTIVMHACREDLEVLHYLTGVFPVNIFDTQLAAAYLNFGFNLGLKALVETCLGITLDKEATRSNWLERPLSDKQCQYAATDASLLMPLHQHLDAVFSNRPAHIRQWFNYDSQQISHRVTQSMDATQAWQAIRRTWKLNACQLNVLQALCAWREERARTLDVPRNRVIHRHTLWQLASALPSHGRSLPSTGLSTIQIKRYGKALLACIAKARQHVDEGLYQQAQAQQPLPKELYRAIIEPVRQSLQSLAQTNSMAVELLLTKKKIIRLIFQVGQQQEKSIMPTAADDWRAQIVVPLLIPIIQQHLADDKAAPSA